MPLMAPFVENPQPPAELTPAEHAALAWSWLREQCAPSTWERFVSSVAVRVPEAKTWTD
jgi:hypothetical protein